MLGGAGLFGHSAEQARLSSAFHCFYQSSHNYFECIGKYRASSFSGSLTLDGLKSRERK